MRRPILLAALPLALVFAAPAAGATFSTGVAAGDITDTSAVVWTRAPRAGAVRVIVIDRDARVPTGRFKKVNARGPGHVVKFTIKGLAPGHHHIFRFIQAGHVSGEGKFETAPRPTSERQVRFVVHGGATTDARPATSNGSLPGADFHIDLGATGAATTTTEQRRVNATKGLRAAGGGYYLWNGIGAGAGRDAFLSRNPAVTGKIGLFRRARWGRNLDLLLLDARSFRSADVRAACPATGGADRAPTMPDVSRGTSGIPSLANPVAAGCRDAIDAPDRRMLGSAQYDALLGALKKSPTRFKVLVSRAARPVLRRSVRPRRGLRQRAPPPARRAARSGERPQERRRPGGCGGRHPGRRAAPPDAGGRRRDRHRHPGDRHRHRGDRTARAPDPTPTGGS